MKRCILFCFVGILLCLGARLLAPEAGAAVAPHPPAPDPLAVERLGLPTVSLLSGITHVETFRVGVTPAFGKPAPIARIDDRAVSAKGRTGDKAFASKVTTVLLDPSLYNAPRDRCLFSPGVVFRLWNGQKCVDCIMCFHCNDILILTHDPQGRIVHTAFTRFTSLRPPLLALVKQSFPNDQEIQVLSAK